MTLSDLDDLIHFSLLSRDIELQMQGRFVVLANGLDMAPRAICCLSVRQITLALIEIIIGSEWHTKEITPQHLKKRPFGGILIPPGSNRERLDLTPSINLKVTGARWPPNSVTARSTLSFCRENAIWPKDQIIKLSLFDAG